MGEKIIVGPINKGLRSDRTPFVIDNDSFPILINAYQWRGRVKRKRGTTLLTRLMRFFDSTNPSYNTTTISFNGSGVQQLLSSYFLETNGSIVPGSVTIVANGITYKDTTQDGFFVPKGLSPNFNTINYATGRIQIPLAAGFVISAQFRYNPNLPVMGLEDLILLVNQYPKTLAFDTVYSYIIQSVYPYNSYDVSFYKNPPTSPALPGYIAKINTPSTASTITPLWWNGNDYQQFWTTNYQGALWATNGIAVPFDGTKIGMQFGVITAMAYVGVPTGPNGPSIVNLTIAGNPLVIGDFVFINEVVYTAPNVANSINFQTGYVIAVAGAIVTVEFPNAFLTGTYSNGGIAQYLTNRSDTTRDVLRWFDGDPTSSNPLTPTLTGNKGWVNFSPPLSRAIYSIADLPAAQYYLVGARMIIPFKDRLLFIGPVIQTSGIIPNPIYLQDTVIYSQNGTPYYTSSFTGDPSLAKTVFFPILVPDNQTATAPAYWEDQTGFGGFISAGVDMPICTASPNGDTLIMGFDRIQTRFVYTGNDAGNPFEFYIINSEMGSSSTFSIINMDQGVVTRGNRGFVITSQTNAQRVDLEIPDDVFEISLINNGAERVCAQRDFINEWAYFTYPNNEIEYKFPNQTLQYNYRDDSWATFRECYTTYGTFRKQTGQTWATLPATLTWKTWNNPWNSGESTLEQQIVIGGNQQGFVMIRDSEGTEEDNSLYISGILTGVITCNNHCLNNNDFIIISGVLGTIGPLVNGKIFSIAQATTNTFTLNPGLGSGSYFGGGLILRMYIPFIQTRQFPVSWAMGRKTRIGTQQYLLTTTDRAQMQLLIYLSQNADDPYNDSNIVPDSGSINNGLIYSTVLYTCPESTNLGLTPASSNMLNPANSNLQMPTAVQQEQIWHRVNTSLIGDTVQLGFTLSDTQMRAVDDAGQPISQFEEIEIHGFNLDVSPSQMLC